MDPMQTSLLKSFVDVTVAHAIWRDGRAGEL